MSKDYQEFKNEIIKLEEDSLRNIVPDKDRDLVAAIIKKYMEDYGNDN